MSISSINYSSSLLGLSVQNINNRLSNLSTQLSTGVKSTDYAGMGTNEGFAVAARSQLANIASFSDTMTGVTTIINAANAALQSLSTTVGQVKSEAAATPQNLTSSGQTIGQQNALAQLSAIVGVMNTQVGSRYIFSGSAINTPAMASADDILNGTPTQAGLKQVIAERQQADGANALGRLVISPSGTMPIQISEDGSPFGLKLAAVSSSSPNPNTTVSGPSGSPPSISINMTANPNPGDQISLTFKLPDGTSESIQLTASSLSPPPANGFSIDSTSSANTFANLNAALNSSIGKLANTSLFAASAVVAGDEFFNTTTAIGNAAQNQAGAPITGLTALSGTAPDSLTTGFAAGDTITVNGQTLKFVSGAASGNNEISTSDNVQTLLSKIQTLEGTTTPSTVNGGVVTLNGNDASKLLVTSSNQAAFAALGFSGGTATATPLRIVPPLSSATRLTSGAANTVAWYTGNSEPGSARSAATVRIDSAQSVQFGSQADEEAIRRAVQNIAVYAAVSTPPGGPNAGAIAPLSLRIGANLTPQTGQQTISDIQTEFATAQTTMKDAQARQSQAKTALQNLISDTEGISQNEVAAKILSLQTSLQASYQTTAMLSQLSLVKFLPTA
ncbi:flagellar protein [Bradyrhizobium sp. STM 3562]|uniref:flagellar protein n=1 Tax=Bradyrhizobium sp. STM 3562 TaxID=578924 RepID=UPI00388DFFD1